MSVVRFGVSLEKELLDELDELVAKNRFSNRSQAIRQLIADNVSRSKWECNNLVVGSITLIYDHHKRDLLNALNEVQHQFYEEVLAAQHFHINHDLCLEIIAVKGRAVRLTELADRLIAVKGVQHGKLTMSRPLPHETTKP
ncbi:MAG TPA: nickel-responsive transcriptional regulator NikR [Bacteroidales bacterium]|jgi:CopG family nickel-responsive transcriptional regulator|nr:nickel-responsive transcriptional regulator NikR [Bacteroidales bacterium]